MGSDSIIPFIQNKTKGAFVLCLTSNNSAKEVQFFKNGNNTVFQFISKLGESLNENNNIGLVVGATNPSFMDQIREANSLPWLIPGIGAQGGNLKQSVTISNKNNSLGLINVSRGIIFSGDCSIDDITNAAKSYNDNINGYDE